MPLVNAPSSDSKAPESTSQEDYTIVSIKTPEDKLALIQLIMSLLSYNAMEYIEIRKDTIYYKYYPNMKVSESEMVDLLIDWYMKTLEK